MTVKFFGPAQRAYIPTSNDDNLIDPADIWIDDSVFSSPGNFVSPFPATLTDALEDLHTLNISGTVPATINIRNTPSLSVLTQIANASHFNNSGSMIIARDQILSEEANVDPSITVQAQVAGLLDASGNAISTSPVQKRTVALARGTILRVFSPTDLRVVLAPTATVRSMMFTDLQQTGTLLHINSQTLYNRHRNRRTVFNSSSLVEVRLFQVQFPSAESILISFEDTFGFVNVGTGGLRIRTFQVGTVFSGSGVTTGATQIDLAQNVDIFVRPRVPTQPQSGAFEVVEQAQSTDISSQVPINQDWFRDEDNRTAVNNDVALHETHVLSTSSVWRHLLSTTSHTQNPIVLFFDSGTYADRIAWVTMWSVFLGNPSQLALGAHPNNIIGNLPNAEQWIADNVSTSTTFEVNEPNSLTGVDSIAHISGNEVRIRLASPVPPTIALDHDIVVAQALNAENNGTFSVTQIGPDPNTIHITNPLISDGTNDEPDSPAHIDVPIYFSISVFDAPGYRVNFVLYHDAARTSLMNAATINDDWFRPDPITDIGDPNYNLDSNILNIFYTNSIDSDAPKLYMFDEVNRPNTVLGGARKTVSYLNNLTGDPDRANRRTLDLNAEIAIVRTDMVVVCYLDIHPDDIPEGEGRVYTVVAPASNGVNTVSAIFGNLTNPVAYDDANSSVVIPSGQSADILVYHAAPGVLGAQILRLNHAYVP